LQEKADLFLFPPYWPLQTLGFSERLSGELAPLASLTSLQKIVLALCQFS
jgi:hypothetical protein